MLGCLGTDDQRCGQVGSGAELQRGGAKIDAVSVGDLLQRATLGKLILGTDA